MTTTNNLLNTTHHFITPDLLQKFTAETGLSDEKIQVGLKSVIPTLLMGLANKASSNEGAQSIINMTKNPTLKGSEAVNGIFGNELTSVTTSLGSATGLSSSSVTKIFGMIAPIVMGVIGKKVNQEAMTANGLMGFLSQQKSSLANIVPTGISNLFGFGASNSAFGKVASSMKDVAHSAKSFPSSPSTTLSLKARKSWIPAALFVAAILGGIWWFMGRQARLDAPRLNRIETTNNTIINTFAGPLANWQKHLPLN